MSVPTASVGSAVGFAPMPTGTGWERTPWEALRKADSSGGRMARIIYESREAWERLWGTIERPREREKYPERPYTSAGARVRACASSDRINLV